MSKSIYIYGTSGNGFVVADIARTCRNDYMIYIGEGMTLNISYFIEHECIIDNVVHILPNIGLTGDVKVEEFTHIGIGSYVIQDIIGRIVIVVGGRRNMIIRNIQDNQKVVGARVQLISSILNEGREVNSHFYVSSLRRVL